MLEGISYFRFFTFSVSELDLLNYGKFLVHSVDFSLSNDLKFIFVDKYAPGNFNVNFLAYRSSVLCIVENQKANCETCGTLCYVNCFFIRYCSGILQGFCKIELFNVICVEI